MEAAILAINEESQMTPEKEQKLFDAFPQMYRGRVKSVQESAMSFGFDCGDGWFDLIWRLSQQIETAARLEGLEPQSEAWPEARQVKQKVGRLRFYLVSPTEAMTALIREAEEDSAKTCEECGIPGSLVGNSGVKTLCKRHA